MAWLTAPGTINRQLFTRNVVRIEQHGSGISIMSQHQEPGAVSTHLQSFGDRFRRSHTFDDHVSSEAPSQLAYSFDSILGPANFFDINTLVRPEASSCLQSMFRTSNHNGFACSVIQGEGQSG